MKHNMNRVLSVVALLMLTIGAWAAQEVTIVKNPTNGGTVTSSVTEGVCTLTVTPADGYYLTVANLTAVKVISGSVVQAPARRSIEIDENVTITPTNESADPSGVTTYTFTVPTDANISVNVTAEFQARTSIANASITLAATEFTYDGTAKEPAVSSVVLEQTTLNAADYEVSYSNNTDAGTATVTVTGKRTYTGTATTTFTISAKSITSDMITLTESSFEYDGNKHIPGVTVKDGNYTLVGGDYDLSYQLVTEGENPVSVNEDAVIDAATYNVVVAGKGNYSGTATKSFAITKAQLSLTVSLQGWTYGETTNTPTLSGNLGNGGVTYTYSVNTVNPEDQSFTTEVPENAGSYIVKATVAETANYASGSATAEFTIAKANLPVGGENGLKVTLADWTYGEAAKEPVVTDNKGNGTVTFTYSVNTEDPKDQAFTATVPENAGSYIVKATVGETTNYNAGEATSTFTIAKADMSMVSVSYNDLNYNGAAQQLFTVNNVPENATVKYICQEISDPNQMICDPNDDMFTTDVPSATNAGYYGIIYQIEETNNYNGIEASQTYCVQIDAATITDVTLSNDELTYNGEAQEVEIASVKAGTLVLSAKNEDYTVSYEMVVEGEDPSPLDKLPVETGTYNVVVTGQGNFKGTKSVNFNIVRKAITDEMVTLNPETFTYDGSAQTPTVTVAYKIDEQTTKTLTEDDYDVSYQKVVVGGTPETVTSPTDAGTYNLVVTAKENGNYSGTASATFTINAASIAGATIAAIAEQTFTGSAITPALTVTLTFGETQTELEQGEDYTVSYSNNVNVGQATATVIGTGNYTGTKTANFNITGKAITDAMVTLSPETFTYNGSAQTPTVTVVDGQTTLTEKTDYTISYQKVDGETTKTVESPTDAGEYNVVVTGKGNYSGTASATFTIAPAEITKVTLSNNKLTYNGEAQEVEIASVKAGTLALTAEDYTVSYEVVYEGGEPKEIDGLPMWTGTYNVVVTGQGNFTGSASATFTIVNRTLDITKLTFHEGWTTFYSLDEELDLPAGYGAYVATNVGNGVVTLTQISCVPKNEPVLLNNATETATDNMEYPFNLLWYAGEDVVVDDNYYYGLHNGSFMRVTGTIPAGKIYLYARVPEAPQLQIVINEGNTTGISGASLVNSEEVKGDLYDLQGRKVVYPKKGLYIKNGRKVVVNNK